MYEDKFTKIFESNFQRYQGGGLLAGDVVKFIDNVLQDEWLKSQTSTIKDKIEEILSTDLNIRVASVFSKRPAVGGGVQQDQQADEFYCDVALERAPGLFTDLITVPVHIITMVDTNGNLAPIPDSFRYDDKSHIATVEPEFNPGQDETCPVFGTKSNEGDKQLASTDTAGSPAGEDNITTAVYLR